MNPAQLRRSIAVCSVSLVVALMSSCTTTRTPGPPPISSSAGPIPQGKANNIFFGGGSAGFPFAGGPITSGLRSGGFSISNSSIDNLLTTGSTTRVGERPGLGTSAGREQFSLLQQARIIRKSNTPDAVESFHYNDEVGAKTMAEIMGGKISKRSGLFPVAGERLKVGLVRYSSIYPHYDVNGKRIIIGDSGNHYEVRIENRTKQRMEVVLSVDGLNVLTGKAASPSQHGFILEPKQTYDVDGFRKDSSTVRSFLFGSVARSKAAGSGGASNVGVIGLAVFEEDEARVKAELLKEQKARDNANAFPGSR
jgi:hypothetical protein